MGVTIVVANVHRGGRIDQHRRRPQLRFSPALHFSPATVTLAVAVELALHALALGGDRRNDRTEGTNTQGHHRMLTERGRAVHRSSCCCCPG